MWSKLSHAVEKAAIDWLTREAPAEGMPLCNFQRLLSVIRPGDIVLVEGRSRVADVIKVITQSPWSHAALYIGRLAEMDEPGLADVIRAHAPCLDPEEPLVVEAILGQGTIITPFSSYRSHHLRLCRPRGIRPEDARQVVAFAISQLGAGYDVRQLLDLARFLLPYSFLPRHFRSSLFNVRPGVNTKNVCSSMIALGFMSVSYPILPVVQRDENGELRYYHRNFRLFTPRDFDYSPYFEIIKYPLISEEDVTNYRDLPWDTQGLFCNSEQDCYQPGEVPSGVSWKKVWKRRIELWGKGLNWPRLPAMAARFLWPDEPPLEEPGRLLVAETPLARKGGES